MINNCYIIGFGFKLISFSRKTVMSRHQSAAGRPEIDQAIENCRKGKFHAKLAFGTIQVFVDTWELSGLYHHYKVTFDEYQRWKRETTRKKLPTGRRKKKLQLA